MWFFTKHELNYYDLEKMSDMELYNFAKSNTVEFANIMHHNDANIYMTDIMCKYNIINKKLIQEQTRQEMMDELHLQEAVEFYRSEEGQLKDLYIQHYELKCARFTVKSELFDKSIAERY